MVGAYESIGEWGGLYISSGNADATILGTGHRSYVKTLKTAWIKNSNSTCSWHGDEPYTSATKISAKYCQWYKCYSDTEACGNWWDEWDTRPMYVKALLSPQDRLREIMQERQAPAVVGLREHLDLDVSVQEMRARETLRRLLGEDKYQRFLKNGFISVRAKSGLVYQIFPGHGMDSITNVYRDGEQVERLCVYLRGDFPPTDMLIMRYLLILNDEKMFRSYANVHRVYLKGPQQAIVEARSLTDIYKELKAHPGKRLKRVA